MKVRTAVVYFGLLAGVLMHSATFAVEALDTRELASHCAHFADKPDSEDGIFCIRYIQGFIDGAVATDERVTYNVADEYERKETYSERATRTRIGHRMELYGYSVYAEFCLGDPVPLKDVVLNVAVDLEDKKLVASNPLARDLVYQTLRTHYPCKESG